MARLIGIQTFRKFPESRHNGDSWGGEQNVYKVVKRLQRLEPFHAHSEGLVLQELGVCFTLIEMARLLADHCEAEMPSAAGKPPLRANFNNCLRTVSQHVGWLLLQQSAALSTKVDSILRNMDGCRRRERPIRYYVRVTHRPDDRCGSSNKKRLADRLPNRECRPPSLNECHWARPGAAYTPIRSRQVGLRQARSPV